MFWLICYGGIGVSFLLLFFFLINVFGFQLQAQGVEPKRAIVIGASVGMGKELSKKLAANGYIVGMTARSIELLKENQQEIQSETYVMQMDASDSHQAVDQLQDLIKQMGGLDLLVLALTGYFDSDFNTDDWQDARPVIDVDVTGFFALARTGLNVFEQQGYGHLVGFTSVDGYHGAATAPAYSAAKAFQSLYMEAERNKYIQGDVPIYVTEIAPGWVNSKDDFDPSEFPQAYWVETLEDATREIYEAIKNKAPVAFITERWRKVAELFAWLPNDLYNALSARPEGGF